MADLSLGPLSALLLAGLLVPVSGCFTCTPQLDVRHCRDTTGGCALEGQVVVDWNPELRDLFPDIDHFLATLAVGDHGHADWTQAQADTLWSFYHVDADAPDKQVFLRHDGGVFRIRVLAC